MNAKLIDALLQIRQLNGEQAVRLFETCATRIDENRKEFAESGLKLNRQITDIVDNILTLEDAIPQPVIDVPAPSMVNVKDAPSDDKADVIELFSNTN